MTGIQARLRALQKERDAQRPKGGILVDVGNCWWAISATTTNAGKTKYDTREAALEALRDCKSILEL